MFPTTYIYVLHTFCSFCSMTMIVYNNKFQDFGDVLVLVPTSECLDMSGQFPKPGPFCCPSN